jgi:RNA polymerase sigma-70 factor (ECF subfamily)
VVVMQHPRTDDELGIFLNQARRGEQTGFTGVYHCLAGRVAGYVRGRGVGDVDEVVNDVFVGAFRNLSTFDGDAVRFRSWIFGIAHNKAADWHRASHRQPRTIPLDGQSFAGVAGVDAALDSIGSGTVSELLAALTDDQRDVLLLRVVADLSLVETAEALDKPVGAVKSLQRRALASLERILSDRAVSPSGPRTTTETRCQNTT